MVMSKLNVEVGGTLWTNGFTAEFIVSNPSSQTIKDWQFSFTTPHSITGSGWGVSTSETTLSDGLSTITVRGQDWGREIPAGESVTVGFNGRQGRSIGTEGPLTAAALITTSDPLISSLEATSVAERSTGNIPSPNIQSSSFNANNQPMNHDLMDYDAATSHGSDFKLITDFATFGGSDHTTHDQLMGGRTPITTEALLAYNNLRAFEGLNPVSLKKIGSWAFNNNLTNNEQAWGNDLQGVGLWYAMQGAKAGWIADASFDPQLLADLQRTARLGSQAAVLQMIAKVEKPGFTDHLQATDGIEAFINTLKMEPHFGGWMHDRAHGWLDMGEGAIAHDVNHLTVLSHDQSQPFMNDSFDWPQWPALDVPHDVVINYFQSMVSLADPLAKDNTTAPAASNNNSGENSGGEAEDPVSSAITAANRIIGSDARDLLRGGSGRDIIKAGKARDRLFGNAGRDRLLGNQGRDQLKGGSANDVLIGGSGRDWLNGQRGNDILIGGSGADVFRLSAGRDVIKDFNLLQGDRLEIAGSHDDFTVRRSGDDLLIKRKGYGVTTMLNVARGQNFNSTEFFADAIAATEQVSTEQSSDEQGSAEIPAAESNQSENQNHKNQSSDNQHMDNQNSDASENVSSNDNSYGEALGLSLLFYEANRSGDLDEATKRVPWRGDSGLNDGRDGVYFGDREDANLQQGLSLDLSGGYHDAGDHGKFGLPLASSLTNLAWGGINFEDGYKAAAELETLLETVRWGTDYLLKAHGTNTNGETAYFVAQVGDVDADHGLWSAPERQTIDRPAMAVTPEKPGSDVAAGSAAALASASVLFRSNGDSDYADELLENAESLFHFADTYRGKYSDSITEVRNHYNSFSGFEDELAFGAAWLGRALNAAGKDGSEYQTLAQTIYNQEITGLNNGWAPNWDDASYGTAVLLATDLNDKAALNDVQSWLDAWVNGESGVQLTDGGLRFISQWGSLRYASNTAMLAGVVADELINPGGQYSDLAINTMDYILGDNPRSSSYVVGFGENSPEQPHHRAASGVDWESFNDDLANTHTLYGALVGGPSQANDFAYSDRRSDYTSNEVAIDYNAGFSSALAFANQQNSLI